MVLLFNSQKCTYFTLGFSLGTVLVGMLCFSLLAGQDTIYPQPKSEVNTSTLIILSNNSSYTNVNKMITRGGYSASGSASQEDLYRKDDDKISERLSREVRILCWIMTYPGGLDTKAIHVRNTWGKRCSVLLFASDYLNTSFPTMNITIQPGPGHLTKKTMDAFDIIYRHYIKDADWFLKADDNTYVVTENLRYFLSNKNASEAVYYGDHYLMESKKGFMSGGAGYVVSKAALERFGQRKKYNVSCLPDGFSEDVNWARCMVSLNVTFGDSRDSLGKTRFNCLNVMHYVKGEFPPFVNDTREFGAQVGIGNLSDFAISYHYVSGFQMYAMEYFTYHLKPYGIVSGLRRVNKEDNAKS